ncbi:MAG: HlyC/CorC family transporter [Bacteroidia bacterium]|jgi:CBS domain containing-hemolysin-like protein|nr:HlyC/CorC family transporter [Bacteroidota bacterium]MBP6639795.1 HlyC/CorC family transporter [Bacteroidia bacterium]MBP8074020.1 HlyC/CorC family transporter [Bacteroidia bacterium]
MALELLFTFFLVFLNGFFVASEFAIVKVRASQLEVRVAEGHRAANLASHIVNHLDGYLAATQLGVTLASLGLGWIGEPVFSKVFLSITHALGIEMDEHLAENIAFVFAFTLMTMLHIIFGELAPKSVAIQRAEKVTLIVSFPLRVFYLVFKPFIWALNGISNVLLRVAGIAPSHEVEVHSNDELKFLMQQGHKTGAIEATDYDIIKNAFNFSERTARQVMVPRTQLLAIDLEDFDDQKLEEILEARFSRIPCHAGGLDNIVGVVYLKDLLLKIRRGEKFEIRDVMRPMPAVPETKKIGPLLKEFQQKHEQIAVVVNEYGGTSGIITMEDILEELVGEIQDEFDDEAPFVEMIKEGTYHVLAGTALDDINDMLPHAIKKDEHYETLAGLLSLRFGSIPAVNDKIEFDGYEFTVLKRDKNVVTLVQLVDLA